MRNKKLNEREMWQQNEKHTKLFHECKRKDDGNTNYYDQVVSIQEPLSKKQPDKQVKKDKSHYKKRQQTETVNTSQYDWHSPCVFLFTEEGLNNQRELRFDDKEVAGHR